MIKNCINCGAPLHGAKCDYCGTEYSENGHIRAEFGKEDGIGVVNLMGKEYRCYVSKMEAVGICSPNAGRDMSGRLFRGDVTYKHKFTLVEV